MRITLLLSIVLAFNSFGESELDRIVPQFHLLKEEVYPSLMGEQAIFKFTIQNMDENVKSATIRYSIDGKETKVKLKDYSFEILTVKGKHRFIIYINNDYEELYSDSLEIKPLHKNTYNVYTRANLRGIEIMVDKPVIYLYPEKEEKIHVEVTPVGEMVFTYPEYKQGWNVTAQPNGTIEHNGNSYNYLFWESKQTMDPNQLEKNGGFIVEKENLLAFIGGKLDEVGFTSKEKADFVTFWVPRMMSFDELFIQFVQGESCNQFAELKITPQPDHVNRFYMSWRENNSDLIVTPQKIEKMDRTGFDVLEWGGQELTKSLNRNVTN